MRVLLVGGTFDSNGGRDSSIIEKLANGVMQELSLKQTGYSEVPENGEETDKFLLINGGFLDYISKVLVQPHPLSQFDAILWFANILDNSLPKIVEDIKKINPKILLVTSKRCVEKDYNRADVISHALKIKSNLILEIRRGGTQYKGVLLDPLGNTFKLKELAGEDFINDSYDFEPIGKIIIRRLRELAKFSRVGSKQVSPEPIVAEGDPLFFETIKSSADLFDSLLPTPKHVERFLGNASFRCGKGFPSFRKDNLIFVSRRNIDKKYIGPEGFVAVDPDAFPVHYYGENKPSVDTPIQLMLYNYYKNVNYMLHGHVRVGAGIGLGLKDREKIKETGHPIPCGAIEEAAAIIRTEPDFTKTNFIVNLSGHGFIALAKEPNFLHRILSGGPGIYGEREDETWEV